MKLRDRKNAMNDTYFSLYRAATVTAYIHRVIEGSNFLVCWTYNEHGVART